MKNHECAIQLRDGREIRCPAYPEPCTYVRIVNQAGAEQCYWNCKEWRTAPEEVMGAIMRVLKGDPTSSSIDVNNTRLVTCCLCHAETPESTAHLHQGEWICDDGCWDERLHNSE
jgi:hypothetical protein